MATTTPGGRYRLSDGRLVNANGQPIEAKKPKAAPDESDAPAGDEADVEPTAEPEPARTGKSRRGK